MSLDAYWNSLLCELKMMTEMSQSQRTLSSYAFFMRPNLRLVNVTCLLRSSLMRVIWIFFLPILDQRDSKGRNLKRIVEKMYHTSALLELNS